jgi:bifunctional DNA-binding transcriptional regulator/antitoxin component of YhaV-PrlF toxin-antitoxin module
MSKIKLTAKRQATFPSKVCTELGVAPGDELELKPAKVSGENVWIIKPATKSRSKWMGSLKHYAGNAKGDHSMKSIRRSVTKGRSSH